MANFWTRLFGRRQARLPAAPAADALAPRTPSPSSVFTPSAPDFVAKGAATESDTKQETLPLPESFYNVEAQDEMHNALEQQNSGDNDLQSTLDTDDMPREKIADALNDFLDAWPWQARWPILERSQRLLVTDGALVLLKEVTRRAETAKDERSAQRLRQCQWLLWRVRQMGTSSAISEFDTMRLAAKEASQNGLHKSPIAQLALDWLNNTHTYLEERRYLEQNPELLTPEAVAALEFLQFQELRVVGDGDVTALHKTLTVLRDVREQGGGVDAIRAAYVNTCGGLALDVPPWLEGVLGQYEALRRRGPETAMVRAQLLAGVLTQAETNREIPPEVIAFLRINLADALREDVNPQYASALEECLRQEMKALEVYTLDRYPQQYAATQNGLGNTYNHRITGNPRDNQDMAIGHYYEALRVFTLANFPTYYAAVHSNLATIFMVRIGGVRRKNLEDALTHAQEALRVYTLADFPVKYAATKEMLGEIYRDRIDGSPQGNMEAAIRFGGNTTGSIRLHLGRPDRSGKKDLPVDLSKMPKRCFISYSFKDAESLPKLLELLPSSVEPVLFPPISVPPTEFVSNELIKAIWACDGLIYFVGGSSDDSFWVALERDYAVRADKRVFSYTQDTAQILEDDSYPLMPMALVGHAYNDSFIVDPIVQYLIDERNVRVNFNLEMTRIGSDDIATINRALDNTGELGGRLLLFVSTHGPITSLIEEVGVDKVRDLFHDRVIFASIVPDATFKQLFYDKERLPNPDYFVQLYEEGVGISANRIDDLVVRLYWFVYRNAKTSFW